MKQALSLLPVILLIISAIHAFINPEKFTFVLTIASSLYLGQQLLSLLSQPDLKLELKELKEKQEKEIQSLRVDTHKQLAELRDDFAKASMILSNKAASVAPAQKPKHMVF